MLSGRQLPGGDSPPPRPAASEQSPVACEFVGLRFFWGLGLGFWGFGVWGLGFLGLGLLKSSLVKGEGFRV